tara:strand:+ start:54 stop:548 length:495 start_codon:yes stop_codon:yes gene_type:complete
VDILDISLFFSILLSALVTGFILTYAIVIMPGLSNLDDKEFIKAFQVTDGIIQNNQPIFILIWIGSIVSVLSTIITSILCLGILDAWLIIFVSVVYLLLVQGITILIHLPLNKSIQNIDINSSNFQTLSKERIAFEKKWNYFNNIRTVVAFIVVLIFLSILTIR